MSRIERMLTTRIHLALKALTVAVLAAATFVAFRADPAVAFDAGCRQRCIDHFGECRTCSAPWDPLVGVYSRCFKSGNTTYCVYVCGGDKCPEDEGTTSNPG